MYRTNRFLSLLNLLSAVIIFFCDAMFELAVAGLGTQQPVLSNGKMLLPWMIMANLAIAWFCHINSYRDDSVGWMFFVDALVGIAALWVLI